MSTHSVCGAGNTSSSRGHGDVHVRSRFRCHIDNAIDRIWHHTNPHEYAVIVFYTPEEFQAACRAIRDLHGLTA